MGDSEKNSYMRGQKTLEINPHHPLIQELKTLVRPHSFCALHAACAPNSYNAPMLAVR